MKDEDLQKRLRDAALPLPAGGLDAARERAMGRVRHQFPATASRFAYALWRSLEATAFVGAIALVVFLAWPEPSAEADSLPSETQMRQLYDQHETRHREHLQEVEQHP